jgi:hypothetical protein
MERDAELTVIPQARKKGSAFFGYWLTAEG